MYTPSYGGAPAYSLDVQPGVDIVHDGLGFWSLLLPIASTIVGSIVGGNQQEAQAQAAAEAAAAAQRQAAADRARAEAEAAALRLRLQVEAAAAARVERDRAEAQARTASPLSLGPLSLGAPIVAGVPNVLLFGAAAALVAAVVIRKR